MMRKIKKQILVIIFLCYSIFLKGGEYKEQYNEIIKYVGDKNDNKINSIKTMENKLDEEKLKIKNKNSINISKLELESKYENYKKDYSQKLKKNNDIRDEIKLNENSISSNLIFEIKSNTKVIDEKLSSEGNKKNLEKIKEIKEKKITENWKENKYIDDVKSKYSEEKINNEISNIENIYSKDYNQNKSEIEKKYKEAKEKKYTDYNENYKNSKENQEEKNSKDLNLIIENRNNEFSKLNKGLENNNKFNNFNENFDHLTQITSSAYKKSEIITNDSLKEHKTKEEKYINQNVMEGIDIRSNSEFENSTKMLEITVRNGGETIGKSISDFSSGIIEVTNNFFEK